jgi:hypothetical protein
MAATQFTADTLQVVMERVVIVVRWGIKECSFISRSSDGINFSLLLQTLRLCRFFNRAISGGR